MDKGDYSKAKEQWEKALSIDPGDPESKNAIESLGIKAAPETKS